MMTISKKMLDQEQRDALDNSGKSLTGDNTTYVNDNTIIDVENTTLHKSQLQRKSQILSK